MLLTTLPCVVGWSWILTTALSSASLDIINTVLHPCSLQSFPNDGRGDGCKEQMDVILKLSMKDVIKKESKYITVDEVFSPDDGENVKLLHPLLIHVHPKNSRLVYPLNYIQSVNNKAYEVFFHKENTDNYQGCTESLIRKTCGTNSGFRTDRKGFCCYCDNYHGDVPYHTRSGQDCHNQFTPLKQDQSAYHSSTHCLKFDSVWYNAYELKKPVVEVEVGVEIYEVDGAGGLSSVTGDQTLLMVGTSSHTVLSSDNRVSVSILNIQHVLQNADPLNYRHNILLMPQMVEKKPLSLQLQGNASEFLVVDRNRLAVSGGVCDKMGVSYKAFVSQRHKCSKPAQSCLENQPMQFWLHDIERQLQNKPTQYFLSGFSEISGTPVVQRSSVLYLCLLCKGSLVADLVLQIRASRVISLRQGTSAKITEISHSKVQRVDVVSVSVYNPGLLSEEYTVYLHSCNSTNTTDQRTPVTVGAHQTSEAVFELEGLSTYNTLACTVSVSNHLLHNVSERTFWFRDSETCICFEDVNCTCQDQRFHLTHDLETKLYNTDPLMVRQGYFTGPADRSFVAVFILLALLTFGVVKGLLSVAFPVQVGQCGLCLFLQGKPLSHYHEKELKGMTVSYNKQGTPIHPTTERPVQMLSCGELLFLNMFFGVYLLFILPHFLLYVCRQYRHKADHQQVFLQLSPSTRTITPEKTDSPVTRSRNPSQIDMQTSSAALTKSERDLALELYKKQKRDLLHRREVSKSPSNTGTNITPPNSETEDSPSRRMTRIKDAPGRHPASDPFSHKQTLMSLLQTDPVFCNVEKALTVYLKNSGDSYSLCGVLTRVKRKFSFQLGAYTIQTYENIAGYPRILTRPQRMLHPTSFTLTLTSVEVHRMITLEPRYPCLNRKLQQAY